MSNKNIEITNKFKQFFEIYQFIAPYLSLNDTQQDYFNENKNWIQRLREVKFPVAFFGPFTSGKSTLINVILHKELLPEGTKSTTAFPTLIKKGSKNQATIYYLDKKGKYRFRGKLIGEIRKIIGDKIPPFNNDSQQYLISIDNAINQYEAESKNKVDRKAYRELKQLIEHWNEKNNQSKQVSLLDLNSYIEGHPDSLFIDRIEVSVVDIDIPDDIILVDLPGVAVANPRHVNFTKEYLSHKAKAFVVCMKPKSLVEGKEAEFLKDINKTNSSILNRSFWIINQWDSLNQVEKQQEERNFQEKISNYHFNIERNRFFKISALQYSLLKHIAEGTLNQTEKRKKEIDTLNSINSDLIEDILQSPERAKSLLNEVKPVQEFSDFLQSLFDYLNTTAKEEFLGSAINDLSIMVKELTEIIRPYYFQYQNQKTDDFRSIRIEAETRKELEQFISQLETKIADFAKDIRISKKSDLWTEDTQSKINQKIDRVLVNTPELQNKLRTGKHQDFDFSILASILKENIGLADILEQHLSVDSFMEKINHFSRELKSINPNYLPKYTVDILEDKLGKRDIQMRLFGVADIVFYELGDKFQEIGLNLKHALNDSEKNSNDLSQSVLDNYRQELKIFVKELKHNINKYLNRSIKNHVEYLATELPILLKHDVNKDAIALQIRENLEKSETVEFEIQKQEAISVAYQKLTELYKSL